MIIFERIVELVKCVVTNLIDVVRQIGIIFPLVLNKFIGG